jgi:tyrosyl-tRNA synthetase
LLTKADGTKFGKTESGTVWLDPEMTSPYAFHQYFLNAEDAMVVAYLKVFSERPREEIDDIARQSEDKPHPPHRPARLGRRHHRPRARPRRA